MKRDNQSRGRRAEGSQEPIRRSKPARPASEGAKPRRKPFAKAEREEGKEATSRRIEFK